MVVSGVTSGLFSCGLIAASGADLRRRARVEPGVEKHPGRRGHRGQTARAAVPARARRAKRMRGRPGQRLCERAGRAKTAIGTVPKDLLPTPPIWESARGCRHPSARQTACAETAGAALSACRRYRSSPSRASMSVTRMRRSAAAISALRKPARRTAPCRRWASAGSAARPATTPRRDRGAGAPGG